jgi:hypothetical protein
LNYTAGFRTRGTIEVLDNDLVGETITVGGVEYAFVATGATGNQINIGTDEEETASNIATKLSLTSSGETVTLALGSLEASSSDEAKLEVLNSNLPEDLKACLAYIIAGGVMDTPKSGEVASYSIGSKSVTLRVDSEKDFVKSTISKYGRDFADTLILS